MNLRSSTKSPIKPKPPNNTPNDTPPSKDTILSNDNTPPPSRSTYSPPRPRYPLDIRIFSLTLITCMLISFLLGITSHIPSRVEERVRVVERQEAVHSFDIGEEIVSGVNSVTNGMILKGTMDSKETCDSTIERSVDFHVNHTTTYPHRPSGQHLLIDLLHVSSSFLNSESQLAAAMVSLITASGLTLLSYHCHSLQPMGVSCVGVLLESHVSFHTWPTEGVITLDLFTCGSASLLPSVSLIQELFGVKSDAKDEIVTKWSHELRGFRIKQERMDHVLDNTNDLANDLLSSLDARKEMVWSERTQWGQVDVDRKSVV